MCFFSFVRISQFWKLLPFMFNGTFIPVAVSSCFSFLHHIPVGYLNLDDTALQWLKKESRTHRYISTFTSKRVKNYAKSDFISSLIQICVHVIKLSYRFTSFASFEEAMDELIKKWCLFIVRYYKIVGLLRRHHFNDYFLFLNTASGKYCKLQYCNYLPVHLLRCFQDEVN